MDNDGISDEEDQDIDGDGFNNTLEINCNSDPQKTLQHLQISITMAYVIL